MALRLRIRSALFAAAFVAGVVSAGFAAGAISASHGTTTAGGMGPHGVIVFQPDPVVIVDR